MSGTGIATERCERWGCLFVACGMLAAALSLPNVVVAVLLVFGLALLITSRKDAIA